MKEEVFREMSLMGSSVTYFAVIVLSLFLNLELAIQLAVGLAVCFLIIWPVKYFWFKKRPDNTKYNGILQKIDASSFPSTHSARSMTLALILGMFFNSTFIYIFLILLALLNGFSRVYQKRHYVSDVIGGYAVGIIAFLAVIFLL